MQKRRLLDETGENVRRARAIAHLTQVAADQGNDIAAEVSLAMCVIEDLLASADTALDQMAH